jgi:hypothetical protein
MGLRMDRLDDDVGRRCHETVDRVRASIGLDLVPPPSPLNSVQMPAKAKSGRSSLRANRTTSFFFVGGFGSGAYSEKLLAGTRQRFGVQPGDRQRRTGRSAAAERLDGCPGRWQPFIAMAASSLASLPTASVFMGSTDIETCSVRSQVEHSNVRTSKPRTPAEMRASAIRCLHIGHIGRSSKLFIT